MAYKKRETSQAVEAAKIRCSAMEEIDKKRSTIIEYGGDDNSITSITLRGDIKGYEDILSEYNKSLQNADEVANRLKAQETKVRSVCTAVLKGASAKFGDDASEIEQLGGTRKSERKPRKRGGGGGTKKG